MSIFHSTCNAMQRNASVRTVMYRANAATQVQLPAVRSATCRNAMHCTVCLFYTFFTERVQWWCAALFCRQCIGLTAVKILMLYLSRTVAIPQWLGDWLCFTSSQCLDWAGAWRSGAPEVFWKLERRSRTSRQVEGRALRFLPLLRFSDKLMLSLYDIFTGYIVFNLRYYQKILIACLPVVW